MAKRNTPFFAAILTCLVGSSCFGWMRGIYEDETVVRRSDLIVVAAIKDGSMRYVPHPVPPGDGRPWEYHAILRVASVIKGKCKSAEIPLTLDYGLTPVGDPELGEVLTSQPVVTKSPLMIEDTSDAAYPIIPDALQNNVWLLRMDQDGRFHIRDPEDLQPLDRREYLACYLAKDPQAAVRADMQHDPRIAVAATRYLVHVEVENICKEPDPVVRCERLLPHFVASHAWQGRDDVNDALVRCGALTGPYLLGVFESTNDIPLQGEIIDIWAKTRYPDAVDVLVTVLDEEHEFWAGERLAPGWWNENVDSIQTQLRRDRYGIVYSAVHALEEIGSPRAGAALEATRRQWLTIPFDTPQIVEACDHALRSLDRKPK